MSMTVKQTLQLALRHFKGEVTIRASTMAKDIAAALKRYDSINRTHEHMNNLLGMRESLNDVEDENSNLRKLLFEAVKRLDDTGRREMILMVQGKMIAAGGFTTCDWEVAEEFDGWKTTIEKLTDLIQTIIEAKGLRDVPRGILLPATWDHAAADALVTEARSHTHKMHRAKTLEELLEMHK